MMNWHKDTKNPDQNPYKNDKKEMIDFFNTL